MEDQAFRRERMLASGLLREISPEEALLLSKGMEAYLAQDRASPSARAPMVMPPPARVAMARPVRTGPR